MQGRRRRTILAGLALLLVAAVIAGPPHAEIRITVRHGDVAGPQVDAAIDLGMVAVSLLVTGARRLAY